MFELSCTSDGCRTGSVDTFKYILIFVKPRRCLNLRLLITYYGTHKYRPSQILKMSILYKVFYTCGNHRVLGNKRWKIK